MSNESVLANPNSPERRDRKEGVSPASVKRSLRLLRWFCPDNLYEGIEGDLMECFYTERMVLGEAKAGRRLFWNVIRFCRPGILLRHRYTIHLNPGDMFLNYLKVMLRNMMKQKVNSVINVFGLTVGIAFSLLIGVFVWMELQVNKHLKDVDRLYLIESSRESSGEFPFLTPSPVAKMMKDQYPTLVENYYRFWDRAITVSKGDKHFRLQGILGDATILKMFGLPVLHGDINRALEGRYAIVITRAAAIKYFGRTDVVGETLSLASEIENNKRFEYEITAVLDDLGKNSLTDFMDINAQIFLSVESRGEFNFPDPDLWTGAMMISYLKLADGHSRDEADAALKNIMKSNTNALLDNLTLKVSPLDSYYLESNNGAVKKMIFTLSIIAVIIMVLAIINFINITIGSAATRLKEIGVRKTIGGVKRQLVFQFFSESVAISVIATVLALVIYSLLKSYFDSIFSSTLVPVSQLGMRGIISVGVFAVVTGFCAGGYPAFFLSSYKTIESLKNKFRSTKGGALFSRSLIAIQFFLAISVFAFSVVITRQVSYFLEKDLGYNNARVLTVSSVPRMWSPAGINKMEAAKQEFLRMPVVESVSLSWEIPNGNYGNLADVYKESTSVEEAVAMPLLMVDDTFDDTYGLSLRDGIFFGGNEKERQVRNIVINEAAQKALSLQRGDRIKVRGAPDSVFFTVSGVVKDFNFFSLHREVKPLAFLHTAQTNAFRYLSFKLSPGNLVNAVNQVQEKWKEVFPDDPFEYMFMDQRLQEMYKTELKLKKAASVATGLMLIIVLTGVIGIVSLNVSRRSKEIGIRKVLGASGISILLLLFREYFRLILIASVVAIPLSYYFSHQWLTAFAYRIDVTWWVFILPVVFVFMLTLLIVGTKSLKAVLTNPCKALRQE